MKVTEHPDGTTVVETGPQRFAAKAWDGETVSTRLLKAVPEERYTFNLIYPADKADVSVALDGHRDFASKAVLQKAAWNFLRNHRHVGTFHTAYTGKGMAKDAAEIVENVVWKDEWPEWRSPTGLIVKGGDWCGGFVWIPECWELIKAGVINGISAEGGVKRAKPTRQALDKLRKD